MNRYDLQHIFEQERESIFEQDGSLREIYIFNVDLSDWQKFLDFLQADRYLYSFKLDSKTQSPIISARQIFEQRSEISPLLSINLRNSLINCHFFSEDEIEFDLAPIDFQELANFTALVDFMSELNNLLRKSVVLTLENRPDFVLIKTEASEDKQQTIYIRRRQ